MIINKSCDTVRVQHFSILALCCNSCTDFTKEFTEQVNKCICSFFLLVFNKTIVPPDKISYLTVWIIRRANPSSSLVHGLESSSVYFLLFSQQRGRDKPAERPAPLPLCVPSGSAADDAAAGRAQSGWNHAYTHNWTRIWLVRKLHPLLADWLRQPPLTRLLRNQDHLLPRLSVTPCSVNAS